MLVATLRPGYGVSRAPASQAAVYPAGVALPAAHPARPGVAAFVRRCVLEKPASEKAKGNLYD